MQWCGYLLLGKMSWSWAGRNTVLGIPSARQDDMDLVAVVVMGLCVVATVFWRRADAHDMTGSPSWMLRCIDLSLANPAAFT